MPHYVTSDALIGHAIFTTHLRHILFLKYIQLHLIGRPDIMTMSCYASNYFAFPISSKKFLVYMYTNVFVILKSIFCLLSFVCYLQEQIFVNYFLAWISADTFYFKCVFIYNGIHNLFIQAFATVYYILRRIILFRACYNFYIIAYELILIANSTFFLSRDFTTLDIISLEIKNSNMVLQGRITFNRIPINISLLLLFLKISF